MITARLCPTMSCVSRENRARSASTASRARCSRCCSAWIARSASAASCACRSRAIRPSAALATIPVARKNSETRIGPCTGAIRHTSTTRLGTIAASATRRMVIERYLATVYRQTIQLMSLAELRAAAHSTVQETSTTEYIATGAGRRQISAAADTTR